MKKRLVIFGMMICMICLAACGKGQAAAGPISEAQALQIGTTTIEQMNGIVSQGGSFEQYEAMPALYNGLQGWQTALEDIGTYEGIKGGTVSFEEDEIKITMEVLGSSHNASVEIVLNGKMQDYVGITTSVHYSTGELMTKAALNTVIGMGTVFAVLILISMIISAFGVISKFEKKPEPAKAAPAPVVEQIIAKEEQLSDDTELVAVIAAAVAAYEGSAVTGGFQVRSIRKVR